jgi:tetratricopeptide (TPR) repeat protein
VTTASLPALQAYADGTLLWHKGRYKDAVALYRTAIDLDPEFAMAHAALGNAYYSYIYNETTKGNEEYQRALALVSRTTLRERMNIQANYANNQGHVEEAERLYQISLQQYPDDWGVLGSYARLLRTNGRARESIAAYETLLRMAPDDTRTHVELATAYEQLGRFRDAVEEYDRAFQIDPAYINTGNVSREYGMALVLNGELQKTETLFTSEVATEKTREVGLRSLALLDLYQGSYARAKSLLEQALALDVKEVAPVSVAREHLQLAILANGEADTKEERAQLTAAIENLKAIDQRVILGAWIGSECARDGLVEQAEQIESAIAPLVDTKSKEQVAYGDVLLGEIALQQGKNEEAIQRFSSAEQQKSTPFSMEGLARAYQGLGDKTRAVAQYEKFVAVPQQALLWEPQQRWLAAHYVLASDYAALGDRKKARQALDPLLVLWKDADASLPLRKDALALEAGIAN